MDLPTFLETSDWEHPSCFCVMRDSPRKAQFLLPSRRDSPAAGMMCLVCPDSECSYFGTFSLDLYPQVDYSNFGIVNISELVKWKKNDIMAVKDTEAGGSLSDAPDNGQDEVAQIEMKQD